jgi:hypothetical protein
MDAFVLLPLMTPVAEADAIVNVNQSVADNHMADL